MCMWLVRRTGMGTSECMNIRTLGIYNFRRAQEFGQSPLKVLQVNPSCATPTPKAILVKSAFNELEKPINTF